MKRFYSALIMLFCAVTMFAQYEPTTTWPYIYKEFMEGELQMPGGKTKTAKFNIHLGNARLHYIDGDLIKEVNSADVFGLRIGSDVYANAGGSILKVLSKSDKGLVCESSEIDVASLNSTSGAYGSSANTLGNQALSSLEGIGGTRSNMNHMELRSSQDSGKILPLIVKKKLVYAFNVVPATQRDVMLVPGVDKNALKAFIKEKKIKWNSVESLQLLVDYLAQ